MLRQRHAETGISLAGMAKAAGLHPNSFNRLYDPKWRPRLDTLRKIRDWLETGQPARSDTIEEFPLAGEGWRIIHDRDGWYLCTDEGATGPFSALRNAVSALRETEAAQ